MGKSYTFIHQREENGRMMLNSIDNGPLVYPTVEENRQTRPKKYSELTEAQQLQDDCDVPAKNIILHSLPPNVYALVNHQEATKDIWDRVKLLMKGTELSYQERECRLFNLFDKFAYVQLIPVNTKFLNALLPEWSKFVTDVKLAKILYPTNYDQLYAYLSQHERHANELRIMRERYPGPLAFVANSQTLYNPYQSPQHSVNPQQQSVSSQPFISLPVTLQSQAEFPRLDYGLAVPTFQQGDDPIEFINKAMAFLSAVASRFPSSNNQLRTSSNPINQATIQDGRVTIQQVQGRQTQSFASTGNREIATTSRGNYAAGQAKEKLLLAKVQEAGQILDEEKLAFIVDPGIAEDYDDTSSAKAVSMANLSSCDLDVLFELQDVGIQNTNSSTPNDLLVLSLVEQMTDHVANLDKENQTNKMVNESLTVELERYKE
ncbi:hypothetical protein Tco_0262173 [Tanacetum coccineum]